MAIGEIRFVSTTFSAVDTKKKLLMNFADTPRWVGLGFGVRVRVYRPN